MKTEQRRRNELYIGQKRRRLHPIVSILYAILCDRPHQYMTSMDDDLRIKTETASSKMVVDGVHLGRHLPMPSVLMLGVWLACAQTFAAPNSSAPADPQKELDQVRGRITTLDTNVKQWQRQGSAAEASIAELERSIRQLEQDLESRKKRLNEVEAEVRSLELQQARHAQELAGANDELKKLINAAYVTFRRSELAVALSSNDAARAARLLHYTRTLQQNRLRHLREINITLATLREFSLDLNQRRARSTAELTKASNDFERATLELNDTRNKLASLTKSIARAQTEIKDLKESQQRLENTIARLAREAAERSRVKVTPRLSDPIKFSGRLARDQGKLPWPVSGVVLGRFGEPRGQTDIPWRGVVIGAKSGTQVRAIAPGKVVYANLLRGFGHMIIVDHGDGYMSLYGYNEKLLKKLGEQVAQGETLGQVGMAATLMEPGLYFELRYHGRPVDPARWLANK